MLEKAKEHLSNYKKQLEQNQQMIVMLQGAIQALEALISSEEKAKEDNNNTNIVE